MGSLTRHDVDALTERLRAPLVQRNRSLAVVVLSALAYVPRGLIRIAGRLLRKVLRRPSSASPADPSPAAVPSGYEDYSQDAAAETLSMHRRYMEIAPTVRRHGEEVASAQRARTALEEQAAALQETLESISGGAAADIEAAYATFQERCGLRNELESTIRRLESHDREAESVRSVISKSELDQERLKRVEGKVKLQLEIAVGRSAPLEELLQAFEEGCASRSLYQEAKRALNGIDERRGIILEGKSPSEIEDAVHNAENELQALLSTNPGVGRRPDEPRSPRAERIDCAADERTKRSGPADSGFAHRH